MSLICNYLVTTYNSALRAEMEVQDMIITNHGVREALLFDNGITCRHRFSNYTCSWLVSFRHQKQWTSCLILIKLSKQKLNDLSMDKKLAVISCGGLHPCHRFLLGHRIILWIQQSDCRKTILDSNMLNEYSGPFESKKNGKGFFRSHRMSFSTMVCFTMTPLVMPT